MKRLLDFFIFKPRPWFTVLCYFTTVLACTGTIILVYLGTNGVTTYIFYGVAALLLGYSVYTLIKFAPKIKHVVISLIHRFGFTKRLLQEFDFRTVITSTVSLGINVSYAIFNVVIAILSRSLWFGAIGAYHLLLVFARADVILSRRKKGRASFVRCGAFLILLAVFLATAVYQLISNDLAFVRFGWTIYAYAAVAFYKIITSTINIFKSRKNSLTTQALRFIGLSDAAVSILTLQTSLLYAFSNEEVNKSLFNALTGFAVCALVLGLGITLLIITITKQRNNNERK